MRIIALLLTVLTGATGLVYEVTWQKYLSTLLGSHSEATAAVLGIFLAGLSVGYVVFGRWTRALVARSASSGHPPRLLAAYAAVEAGIGVYALLFPMLFAGVRWLSFLVPHAAAGIGFAFDVALAALLILPPTILMGGTIPMLTQALSRSLEDATRFHAFVYAFNTAGAVVGALGASFALIPWLGLRSVMFAMGAINLAAASIFAVLSPRAARLAAGASESESASVARASRSRELRLCAAVALLVGFAMMVVQTVLIRIAGLSFGSSQFTFAMVVAVFVLCIAIGSFVVSALPRIPRALLLLDLALLLLLLYLIHPILGVGPFWAHRLRALFVSNEVAFHPYYLAGFLGMLVLVGPAVVLSGAALPLLFHQLRDREGDLGAVAGSLYGWNTVGSLLGALLGGYLLLFWLDLDQVYRIALAAVAVAALLLFVGLYEVSRLGGAAVSLGVLGALWLLAPWDPEQLSIGLFRSRKLLPLPHYDAAAANRYVRGGHQLRFYDDDPVASIAVYEVPLPGSRSGLSILSNGKSDGISNGGASGSTRTDYPTTALAALLPALVADRLETAFVIGFGTGVSAGELAAFESTRRVVVAEISPGVVAAAPLFDPVNLGATRRPEVEIVRSDAYRALLRSDERFDAIVSEPSNPWVTGIEMLFSREFLQAAKERLRPGGVYLQWYHQYETDAASVELVLRTYLSVFDQVAVWYGTGPDLLLLGFPGPAAGLDLERIEERAARADVAAGLRRCGVEGLPELLAHELVPAGVLQAIGLNGPLHTLLHPRLSYAAGKAFFVGGIGGLPFGGFGEPAREGARHSLLRRYLARWSGAVPDEVYAALAGEACSYRIDRCTVTLAHWSLRHPESPALARAIADASVSPMFGGLLDKGKVLLVRTLLAGAQPPADDGATPLARARQETAAFATHYDHAFAFDTARLLERWDRCAGVPDECERGRATTRALLANGGRHDAAETSVPPSQ